MAVGVFVIANDFTALSVALPAIEKRYGADLTDRQWVINGYAMVFGVLIVTGGRLADIFGRRRSSSSARRSSPCPPSLGGFAPNIWVCSRRARLMGVGGATIGRRFSADYPPPPDGKEGLAGGIILGAAGFGNAVGPLSAAADRHDRLAMDLLPQPADRRLRYPVTLAVIPQDKANGRASDGLWRHRRALPGLLALLLALDEGTDFGWFDVAHHRPVHVGVTGAHRLRDSGAADGDRALVPGDVIANRPFLAACVATLLMSGLFFSALLYLPQFMMKRLEYSAIGAGAGLLPLMGVFAATSFVAGPLYNRLGPKSSSPPARPRLPPACSSCRAIATDTPYPGADPRHGR